MKKFEVGAGAVEIWGCEDFGRVKVYHVDSADHLVVIQPVKQNLTEANCAVVRRGELL